MELWNKIKGKVAVGALTFILGIPAVVGFTGIDIVDGPDGSLCIVAGENIEAASLDELAE